MQNRGFLLFSAVCIICATVLLYNIGGLFKIETKAFEGSFEEDLFLSSPYEESIAGNTTEKEQATEKTEEKKVQTEVSSQAVEAGAAAVKGKVIKKYISPYNAALSYNGVYMKNSTGTNINLKSLLSSDLKLKIEDTDKPQVLIMHTHTTESFMEQDAEFYTAEFKSRSTDNSKNMVKIGEIVAEKLNNAGIKTLHATTQHDYPAYSGSYTRSAKTVNEYLNKYPSIKVVLDLHRDAVSSGESDKVKLVTEIEGKKAAQVMLVMGSETGSVTGYPNWQENLKLALRLQQTLEVKYPSLARPLSLVSSKYNQNLTTGSMLIEFGTDANSFEEVWYSAELVGNSIAAVLNNLKQ